MTRSTRAPSRALLSAAAIAAVLSIGLFAGAAPAWAHVHVNADHAERGAETVLTFVVPNESDNGAMTTELNVALPNPTSAQAEAMPGWTARLDRDVSAGTVRSVTWTAAPGAGISPDQFALFRITATLPNSATASYAATQTYSDGTVVKWDQPPLPGGGEPEHPVPTLTLSAERQAQQPPADTADNTALWVGIAAVAIGAAGVVLGVLELASTGIVRATAAVVLAAVLTIVTLAVAPAASAHATRIAVDPPENASLTTGPAQVSATFNEPLQTTFAAMTVVGPDGNLWSTGDPRIQGAVCSVALRPLGPVGSYTVNYRVTSADGHVVSGSWSFRLTTPGTGTPGPPASTPSVPGGAPIWPFIAIGVLIILGVAWWGVRRRAKPDA